MPSLTINFIGTGHDSSETYNTLVVAHELVNAVDLSQSAQKGPLASVLANVPLAANRDYKLLLDGPSDAGFGMKNCRDLVQRIVGQLPNHTVNMVGHSRGAVNAIMVADLMHRDNNPNRVNLFCLDCVKMV